MNRRLYGLLLIAGLLLPVAAQADDVTPAWEFTSAGAESNNGSGYSMGEVFTVGSQNITVDYLGYFYDSSASMSESHPVALYDASGDQLASSTITSGSTASSSNFLYNSITPITLLAGQTYVIDGASGLQDPYTWDTNGFTTNADITLLGDNYSGNGGSSADDTGVTPANDVIDGYWGADFGYEEVPPPVPEPSSFVLLGSGLAALAGVIKRKLKA
jgi:hypothetical protein